jgi:uncharacterized protein YggT (Ycf19 family)
MFRTRNIIGGIINIILTVVEAFLIFRLVLKLLGANQSAEFVQWIYQTSAPLLVPFEGIFPTVVESGVVVEMSTLFAIMVYAVIGYLLIALVDTVYRASK